MQLDPIAAKQLQGLRARLSRQYEALEAGLLAMEDVASRIKELREAIAAAEEKRAKTVEAAAGREPGPVSLATVLRKARVRSCDSALRSLPGEAAFSVGRARTV